MSHIHPSEPPESKAWYQETYLWLVLAPLIAVVCSSTVMLTIAFSQSDDLVVDNYYREGKMLAQDFAADEYATQMGIRGQFRILAKRIEIDVNQAPANNTLVLLVSHPAHSELDQKLRLTPYTTQGQDGGTLTTYIANIEGELLPGRWYLRVSAYANQEGNDAEIWRLHGEIDLSQTRETDLR